MARNPQKDECTILLPAYVFDDSIGRLVAALSQADGFHFVRLDLRLVKYYIPAGIVILAAKLRHLSDQGAQCFLAGCKECVALRYLQRMDFFERLGIKLDEDFQRHQSSTNFVTVHEITANTVRVEIVASQLAESVTSGQNNQEFYRLLEYSCSEAILNCKQHAGGVGYVCAQYAPKHDFARIGIADCGMGILGSFRENYSPHYKIGMTDRNALDLAMRPRVSSKRHITHMYGGPINEGIGLNMLEGLVRTSFGWMFLASGEAAWSLQGDTNAKLTSFSNGVSFQGTALSLAFKRSQCENFMVMREQAWQRLGLSPAKKGPKLNMQ